MARSQCFVNEADYQRYFAVHRSDAISGGDVAGREERDDGRRADALDDQRALDEADDEADDEDDLDDEDDDVDDDEE